MKSLENRNRKIIDVVIRKEQAVCPGSIALIGISAVAGILVYGV